MKMAILVATMVLLASSPMWAQLPTGFDDVPPWHWAFEAVAQVAGAGIVIGYPTSDAERAANALTQVYEAFLHAAHPAAPAWADRFLTNLPPNWPQLLKRSRLVNVSLEDVRSDLAGNRGTVSVLSTVVVRTASGSTTIRSAMRVEVRKEADGRWRVDFGSLTRNQPELFK